MSRSFNLLKQNNIFKVFALVFAIWGMTLVFGPGKAHAATIAVSGGCSIENAIASANTDSGTGGCNAGSGADTISIPAGTFTLTATTNITDITIVQGAGMGQTIVDGAAAYGAFDCNVSGTTSSLQVRDLTIQNSGTYPIEASNCDLDVHNVEITGSTLGSNNSVSVDLSEPHAYTVNIDGLYVHQNHFNGGSGLIVIEGGSPGSTLSTNFTVSNYTFTDNINDGMNAPMGAIGARVGGGVSDSIHAIIRNSTFSNVLSADAMGIFFFATQPNGGSGATATAVVDVQNVTVARNIFTLSGPYTASGITAIAMAAPGNTASVTYNLQNTLMAGNTVSAALANCQAYKINSGGTETITFNSLGNNIADDATCGLTASGDHQSVSGLESTLETIALNGIAIPTIALKEASPAVDGGVAISSITADQRGHARPQGTAFDVGAFESDFSHVTQGAGASPAKAPGVPNTGFALLMNNPIGIFSVTVVCSVTIFVIARKYRHNS